MNIGIDIDDTIPILLSNSSIINFLLLIDVLKIG